MPITLQLPSQSMISNQSPANQFPADLTNLPLISRSSPTSPTYLHKSPIDLRPQACGAQWTLLGTQWQQSPIDLPPISYQPSCLAKSPIDLHNAPPISETLKVVRDAPLPVGVIKARETATAVRGTAAKAAAVAAAIEVSAAVVVATLKRWAFSPAVTAEPPADEAE
eukprot:CAMPEP_0181249568 /NCGR_PEP_ID=MMETSP1096-20121128/45831_1 /TAXON_ID=156174 ORGANISM="Chrysochromulina ericina, Strain CCMP281" /NCGR_SAMPLE_ID=MMETSP1096 /ASSEMBLY_ACC=CAM_ASM_000453 /LENGTH=166 /DNA_ID=CAMNT_0023346929 /DNA_START=655 /DNA_END=1157 /DNA_ORIENTATION=-